MNLVKLEDQSFFTGVRICIHFMRRYIFNTGCEGLGRPLLCTVTPAQPFNCSGTVSSWSVIKLFRTSLRHVITIGNTVYHRLLTQRLLKIQVSQSFDILTCRIKASQCGNKVQFALN